MNVFKSKWFPSLVAVVPLFFPLYLFKASWFGVPVNLIEVVILLLFAAFIFMEGLWRPKWWYRHGSEWKLWSVALFTLAAILSTIFVQKGGVFLDGTPFDAQYRALGILKGWILIPLLYFVMARHYFRLKPSLIRLSLDALLWGGAILALMAVKQELSGSFLTMDGRASGPFESANYLSLYLGPLLVYGVLQLVQDKEWRFLKHLRLASTALVAVGLFFTESYAAWIGVLSSLGLWLLLSFKSWPARWRQAILTLFVLGVLILIVSQLGSDKFEQFLDVSSRSSSSVRLQVYEISLHLIKAHPILGLGLGAFEWFYQVSATEILGEAPYEWVMLHPHNIFLAMWLNMGLMGLVAFIWLCVQALGWILERDAKGRRLAAFMLVTILVHGLFDTPYFKNDLALQFWLLMAILI